MKAFRHKRRAQKSSPRKSESTGKTMPVAKSGSKKFQMEFLETRILLSDTSLTMLPLDLPNDGSAPPDAPLVQTTDQTSSPSVTDNAAVTPTSKEGQTLDVAFNSASGEMLLASNSEIVRLDSSTHAALGSFDIPGSDFTGALGLQYLPSAVASLGGIAVDAGSLLVTNGTNSTVSIFAVDSSTGAIKATLNLGQGFDAVAGAFDSGRGTLFVLDASNDRILELNPADGSVLNGFAAPFAIGAGGLAIDPNTGNLWIGSDQSNSLAEMTPNGSLVRLVDVTSAGINYEISGLAFKGSNFLISSTHGNTFEIHDPAVSISSVTGNAGTTVTVAVNISDTTALESVDIGGSFFGGLPGIVYDTNVLDATNASVRAGSVIPAGASLVANVNDAAGTINVGIAFTSAPALASGSIILIDFQIKAGASAGTARIDLQRVALTEGSVIISPSPIPGPDSTDGVITIGTVTANQPPVVNDQPFTLAENTANGTTVGTIVATDPDAGQSLTFSVTGGTGQTAFAVSAAGIITVANSTLLNFETTPSLTLNVTATDNGTPTLSDTAVITINLTNVNEPPVVNAATFTLAENSANSTAVGTVTAADPDAGSVLTYSIIGGNTGGAFAINAATGAITVATSAALNFETTPTFSLTVQAVDNGAPTRNGSNTITINLTNVNEAPVVNDQTFAVGSNAINGAVVGTIAATDPDAGSVLAYSITSGNTGGAFALNAATGQITVASAAALAGISSFALNVTVSDNGAPQLSDTAVITIGVTLVNQPPVVNDQTFTIAENLANGTAVGTIVSTDPDAGQTRTISVTGGTGQTVFAVSATGAITVANGTALNFETTPSFTLNVTVTDNGAPQLSDTAIITINLTNVNETPVVNAATFTLAENSPNGTAVGTVTATDPDAGTVLAYSITGGNTGGAFAINAATGAITVAASLALNFETTPSFSLTVTATDNGTPVLIGSNTVTINLTNVNEAPVVNAATFSLAENSANGTAVGTVTATDPDAGTVLAYSITGGNTGGAFAINAATGAITVATSSALNFETTPTFSLTVAATDNGTPVLIGSNTITINLTNVNEAPVVNAATFSLPENSANGTAVGTVTATDPDAGTVLAYSITGGNTGGAFAINAATGAITVAASSALNFETTPSFSLTVTATDNGTPVLIGSNTVTINLTNVNEAPAVNAATFSLPENSANGTAVGTVTATDPDAGTVLAYSITGGNTGGAFAINAATGAITVAASSALNFETTPSFSLTVTATDNGTPVLIGSNTVTINLTNVNEAPAVNAATFSLPENSANGTAVGTVTATDPDAGTVLAYSITGGNTGGAFAINAATGAITVAASSALNFETTPSFSLTVTATDNGTPVLIGSNTITINLTNVNEAPVVNAATFSLAENSANGTAVGTVTATDPDAATILSYSITGGNTGGAFAINAATGAITVAASSALNFETTPSFSLTVTATDNGTPVLSGNNTITVNLTNVNEAPVVNAATFSLAENSANGTAVGTVTATDPDAGTVLAYSITGGNTGSAFAINSATGAITVAASSALNFETTPNFSLTVTATDNGTPVLIGSNTITINLTNVNEAPVVNAATFTLAENSANGTAVGTVSATDPDAGTVLAYGITGGNTGSAFAINSATGAITVAASSALNFETTPTFSLTVTATDNGTPVLIGSNTITINLTNVNEAPVVNDQTFAVGSNAINGAVVGTIAATDPDAGSVLAYSISSGNTGGAFALNAATGQITVASAAALAGASSFALNVTVSDNGAPQLSDTAVITIGVTNVNQPPVVNDQTFTVAENSANGTAVGTIVSTDPDAGQTRTISVTGGTGQTVFAVSATGAITVTNGTALNFETTPSFTLNVTVTDNGAPQLSDTAIITINLTNVNETPVVNAATFSLAENTGNGTAVGTVTATDPDAGTVLAYSITGGNTGGAFAINAATGAITVATSSALNFETTPTFSLTVAATDNGTPVLIGSNTITINLTNVNEAPVVNAATFSLAENSANGTVVGTVTANDPDAGQTRTFSVTGGTGQAAFAVSAAGIITVANSALLNFETTPSFTLNVTVTDNGTPQLSDTAIITINLTNVNEAPVVDDQTFMVAENTANGTTVGTIAATDPDAGQTRTFSVTGGTGQTAFAVSAAGVITVANSSLLNFETTPSFTLNVTVTDNGTPTTLSDTAVITINLTNVNEAPVVNDQNFTVGSNAINGAVVGTVLAADPDAGSVLAYSITSGNTGGAFALNAVTGQMTVANAAQLTITSSFAVTVTVTDNGAPQLSDTAVITIDVNNVNQPPVVNDQTFTVAENTANGTTVGTIAATDPNAGQTLTFSVTGGTGQAAFAVSAAGVITVANIALLNFESTPSFTLNVTVTDNGTPQLSDTAIITINLTNVNEAPVVDDQTFTVAENTGNGTTVGTIVSTDPDAGQTRTFSVTGGTGQTVFAVSAAGVITVANSTALNFETTPSFTLNVTVTDNGTPQLSDTAIITINLTNVNEAPVVNAATFTLSENSANGTAVGTVTATDPDAGTTLTYSITAGNTGGAFAINGATGAITVATSSALNFETTPSFSLTVTATDNGTPVLMGTNTITVNLTKVVNQPPVVTAPASITIAATSAGGATAATSQVLAAFLASGSAVDPSDPAPVPLTPQINGVDVTPTTQFAFGTTAVTFRFRNAAGLIGTATSNVTVILGTISISNSIVGKGVDALGNFYVDLNLTNTGTGNAVNLAITEASFRTLTGTGSVSLLNPGTITVGNLEAGASVTIRILLNRPVTVKRFSFTQTMTLNDVTGAVFSTSASQAIIP